MKWVLSILMVFSCLSVPAEAQTLARLEAITARYPSLSAFLNDPEAISEYREALKSYLSEKNSFDRVYDEFIKQIREVNEKISQFGEQAWAPNPNWEKESFVIKGEYPGSGLEIKRELVLTAVEKVKAEAKSQVGDLSQPPDQINRLVGDLRSTYGLLPKSETEKFTRPEFAAYQRRLGGDVTKGIPKIADHPSAKILAAHIANQVLSHDEAMMDALHSGDADITAAALRRLSRPAEFRNSSIVKSFGVPPEIFGYLSFSTETSAQLIVAYDAGIQSMKHFRHIGDPRLNPALLGKIQALRARGVDRHSFSEHLLPEEYRDLEQWEDYSATVREQKLEHSAKHNTENAYFTYALHEDPVRHTLRLKSDSGTEVWFLPTPRPFHAFFAGRKTGECVGGRDCGGLVPKRWARAALKMAQSLFTETGDGKMEGMVATTRLVHRGEDGLKNYDVVDLMSRAIKGDIIVRGENGRPIKYSFFDYFIDRYPVRSGSQGLVISDGNNVSQNIGGSEVVNYSPAYLENRIVGKPEDFSPFDPLALEIAEKFPQTLNNYGKGGMIYDGMKGDGTKVVHLVPSSQRRKWTKEELESEVLFRLILKEEISDRDSLWKRSQESGIPLQSLAFYHAQSELPESTLVAAALKRLKSDLVKGGGWHPDLREPRILREIILAYPDSPAVRGLFLDLLVSQKGTLLASTAADGLAKAIRAHPQTKALVSTELLEALRNNLPLSASRDGAFAALGAAMGANPTNETLRSNKIFEELNNALEPMVAMHISTRLKHLIQNYPNSKAVHAFFAYLLNGGSLRMAGLAAGQLRTALSALSGQSTLASPELLGALKWNVLHRPGVVVEAFEILLQAIKSHPGSSDVHSTLGDLLIQSAGTETAARAAEILKGGISIHPTEDGLISPRLLSGIRINLTDHPGSEAAKNSAGALEHAFMAHPDRKELFDPGLLMGLQINLSKDPNTIAARMAVFALRAAIAADPSNVNLVSAEITQGLRSALAADESREPLIAWHSLVALGDLMGAHPDQAVFKSANFIEDIRHFLEPLSLHKVEEVINNLAKRHPNSGAVQHLLKQLMTNPADGPLAEPVAEGFSKMLFPLFAESRVSPELFSLIEDLVVHSPGNSAAGQLLRALGSTIELHPTSKTLLSGKLLEGVKINLVEHAGTEAAAMAGYVLGRAITANPEEKALISAAILKGIEVNLAEYPGTEAARWALFVLDRAIETHPREKSLVSEALLEGIRINLEEGRSGMAALLAKYALKSAITIHPGAVLRSTAGKATLELDPEDELIGHALVIQALFSPEHRRDLVRVVRSGDVDFVNQEVARRIEGKIAPSILANADSRVARRQLEPSPTGKYDCERALQQLYLKYRPGTKGD